MNFKMKGTEFAGLLWMISLISVLIIMILDISDFSGLEMVIFLSILAILTNVNGTIIYLHSKNHPFEFNVNLLLVPLIIIFISVIAVLYGADSSAMVLGVFLAFFSLLIVLIIQSNQSAQATEST